ncbi:MAG: SpoIIE family protein phosphatase [Prevotella sp.]|nr:SpoIIE family protein phosphatase [Prevotella sp.]
MNKFNRWRKSLQTKSTLAIIIIAGILIELTSAVQYWYAQKGIREAVQNRAESELRVKGLEIQKIMTAMETAAHNMSWLMEQQLNSPDSIKGLLRHIVENNPTIVGCGIGFEPNFYPQFGHWYEPYASRLENGNIEVRQIGSEHHKYHEAEWYAKTIATDKDYWSEPYFDDAGALETLCSYAVPIRDSKRRIAGVLCVDVSLEWLSSIINANPIYPSSYNLLISRSGQLMACPVESLVMKASIQEATSRVEDTTVNRVNRDIMSGIRGKATIINEKGEKDYVFYAPVEGETGWSMAVVCSDREIFYGLRQVGFNLFLLMLAGLGLLAYIMFRTIRGFKTLQAVNAEKERIGSELHIASAIQMGMLPKIFPPYPERDDVDIYASLVPAKEVGGDLYDFYIRDEKLFFCIGDVSGKGVPASLVMAVTRSLFRTVSAHEASPSRILTIMNESMSDMNESNMFVTLFVGVLDLPTGRLHYSNAGHEAPLLIGQGIGLLPIESNVPVGIMPGWKFTDQEALIKPQTCIFTYTDGLTEAENLEHQQFGKQRMSDVAQELLAENQHKPSSLLDSMTKAVHEFVGEAEPSDDLTMLAIQYTKQILDTRFRRELTLSNDVQQVPRLAEFVDEVCELAEFDMSTTMQMNLAIEEAVVNVMNYAYPAGTKGDVHIEAQANDVRLKFVISDSGTPFDPTAKEQVDTTLSAEERPIGGLGIHLVRQLMDSINYERIDGKNILTLRKNFN